MTEARKDGDVMAMRENTLNLLGKAQDFPLQAPHSPTTASSDSQGTQFSKKCFS